MRHLSVLAIGHVTLDLVARVARRGKPGLEQRRVGGKALNQAVAAGRLGAQATIVSAVGNDDAGEEIRELLKAEGIDVGLLMIASGGPARDRVNSSVTVHLVEGRGPRGRRVQVDEDRRLFDYYDMAVRRASERAGFPWDVVFLTYEFPRSAVLEALDFLSSIKSDPSGSRPLVVVNPAPALARPMGRTLVSALRDGADILVPNRNEAALMLGRDEHPNSRRYWEDRARELVELCGAKGVCITLGRQGAVWATPTSCGSTGSLECEARDTVGASDVFASTLGVAARSGASFPQAVALATVSAGLAVAHEGGATAAPRVADLNRRLRSAAGVPNYEEAVAACKLLAARASG